MFMARSLQSAPQIPAYLSHARGVSIKRQARFDALRVIFQNSVEQLLLNRSTTAHGY